MTRDAAPPSAPVRAALAALPALARNGDGWVGPCPYCGTAGLRLRQARDGRALLECPERCATAEICAAAGIAPAALFTGAQPPASVAPRTLYREAELRDDVAAGRVILLCEQPEDVDAARGLGLAATAPIAQVAARAEVLAGARVVLLPHGDETGAKLAAEAAAALFDVDAEVRVLHATEATADLSAWPIERIVKRSRDWFPGEPMPEPEPPSRFRLLTVADLADLPPLTWLADGILTAGGLASLYGAPGSGKSFLATDLVLSVAAGIPWLGREVLQGGAIYFAAEGTAGLPQRVAAWLLAHPEADVRAARIVTESVNLMSDEDVAHVRRAGDALEDETGRPLRLVVVDTLARSMAGGDENSTPDMNAVLERAARVQRETGALVLLVHHTKKDSDTERGSTTLRGAVDTLILAKEVDGSRQLLCEKQKDGPEFAPIPFSLTATSVSCVVTLDSQPADARPQGLTPHMRNALLTLARSFLPEGATATEWGTATTEEHRISVASFYRARTDLVTAEYVTDPDGKRGRKYALTPTGRYVVRAIETGDADALRAL